MVVKFVTEVVKAGVKKFGSKVVQKKTARDILDKSKKQLQKVMDRGSYSLKDPHMREFLKEQRKKTVKKILKINKPK